MKRIFLTFVVMLLTVFVYGQHPHLKFMGIPLNGTIATFHQKLVQKGCTPDVKYNKQSAPGIRAFHGVFCGKKASILVFYNTKTKIVYAAKACIDIEDEDIIKSYYNEFKNMISDKYNNTLTVPSSYKGYDKYSWLIYTNSERNDCLGDIHIWITALSYPEIYTLHVEYDDAFNQCKNSSSNMDDL